MVLVINFKCILLDKWKCHFTYNYFSSHHLLSIFKQINTFFYSRTNISCKFILTTEKPKGCGRIRNFKVYEDEDGCKADREIDMGYCYGGCDEATMDNDMCCTGTEFEYKFAILNCPSTDDKEVVRKNKFIKQIKSCNCINPSAAKEPEPAMQIVDNQEQPTENMVDNNSIVEQEPIQTVV